MPETLAQPEKHVDLTMAAKLFPGDPSTACIWRWCRKGVKGRNGERVKLQHVRSGGKLFTTRQWADEFLAAIRQADDQHFSEAGEGGASCGLISQCGAPAPAPIVSHHQPRSARQRAAAIHQAELEVASWKK